MEISQILKTGNVLGKETYNSQRIVSMLGKRCPTITSTLRSFMKRQTSDTSSDNECRKE